MATYIHHECPSVKVEILDGELISHRDIIRRMDADIIGINSNTVTYHQALAIAEEAKRQGSKVVLGGVHASAIPDLILRKRSGIIDSVVVGYGEKPMVDIINGNKSQLIINERPVFNELPCADRSLIDLERYIDLFRINHPTWDYRATHIFTNVGCRWRAESNGGCVFCSRSGPIPVRKSPKKIWEEIRQLVESHEIDYVVDFSDSILQDTDWLLGLVEAKPGDINVRWHTFARIDQINKNSLKLIKALPCVHMFVGFESGDDTLYRHARKGGGSPSESIKIAKLLHEHDIQLTPSYVLGLPGETERSLRRTLEHAQIVKEISGFEELFCCQLIPFPGSLSFARLKKEVKLDSDLFDVEQLKRLWAETFCNVDFHTMTEYLNAILALGTYTITIRQDDLPIVENSLL